MGRGKEEYTLNYRHTAIWNKRRTQNTRIRDGILNIHSECLQCEHTTVVES